MGQLLPRTALLALLVSGCPTEIVELRLGDGGTAEAGGSGPGGAGQGGAPSETPAVVVELVTPAGSDPDEVSVLLSRADGSAKAAWHGGDLPLELATGPGGVVEDGDLVTYLWFWESYSMADTYRVTPDVTRIRSAAGAWPEQERCELQPPMTVTYELPEIEPGLEVVVSTEETTHVAFSEPGVNVAEIRDCVGVTELDLFVLIRDGGIVAFDRIDGLPYRPGTTLELPLELGIERELVDIVVHAQQPVLVGAYAEWRGLGVGAHDFSSGPSRPQTDVTFAFGPIAAGSGERYLDAFTVTDAGCRGSGSWIYGPMDGPLAVDVDRLADLSWGSESTLTLSAEGERGDVVWRLTSNSEVSWWVVHDDPSGAHPSPPSPSIPDGFAPGFIWPNPSQAWWWATAMHVDHEDIEGYADFLARGAVEPPPRGTGRHLDSWCSAP